MKTRWLHNLFDLFFPNLCLACGENPLHGQEIFCTTCHRSLPVTNMHQMSENRFTDRFFGRIYLQAGAAIYHFHEGSSVQQLIHQLKYYGKARIGIKLGELYGKQLHQSKYFQEIDVIVPVPLHPVKERKRGYNQSDQFALGLSNAMQKPWLKHGLKRTKYGKSQTRKNQLERYENVMTSFAVEQSEKLVGKHILLVDDVLTTGATMEACASQLLTIPDTKISMATIAIAGAT
ncbi:MAG: phosphoribosyltransferase family protein [Bacteroidota bacterium]